MSTFSFFVYFFAKVIIEEQNNSNMVMPFFLVSNMFTYVAFFAVSIYRKWNYE